MTRQLITVTNTTVVNTETMCELLRKIAALGLSGPITLVLDNARYQHNAVVQALAKELGITLMFLPSYSPNLNLIERLWKFIKRRALYGRYHPTFAEFQAAIEEIIDGLSTTHAEATGNADDAQLSAIRRCFTPGRVKYITASSPIDAGPPAGWHVGTSPLSWLDSPPRASSSWPATTPSPNIPERRSTARAVTATRSALPTRSPPIVGGISGSSWCCWSASPSAAGACLAADDGLVSIRGQDDRRDYQAAHKTPVDLLAQMLRILIRWFPDRAFVCSADGNYAAHELAELAAAHPRRLTFVSKFYPHANLFEPPPRYSGNGRPPGKGKELPDPAQVVRDTPRRSFLKVAWYGGEQRRVEVVTGSGLWYRSGHPLVPVRWAFVRDRTGTHRDDYFFTTDVTMGPKAVIETYTGRWNIETTFQEARSYLGLETTRGRSRNTVLRAEPCLLALYTLVVWLYAELPVRYRRVARWLVA